MPDFTYHLVFYAIILGLGSLSGIFSERVGIINIGIEGMMTMGALGYAIGAGVIFKANPDLTSPWFQIPLLVVATIFGMLFACLHGLATIKLKSDHTISGVAINILAIGLATLFLSNNVMGNSKNQIPTNITELAYGPNGYKNILSLKTFLFLAIIITAFIMLQKTKWGLRLKAIGENPQAVDAAGINVYSYKWQGIAISGAIAGIAGGFFAQEVTSSFSGSVSGLGFLALAVMIMSHWNVLYVFISSFVFAGFYQLGNMQNSNLLKTLPYIATLISLVVFSKSAPGPAVVGINYDKSKR